MAWAYEGIAGYVMTSHTANHKPLYRVWNGKDHFYTSSKREYDGLPNNYDREGIACYIGSSQTAGHTPLFRLYKGDGGDHFYTTSAKEKNRAVRQLGYSFESTVGYIAVHKDPVHVPLYRAYNGSIVDHFYTLGVRSFKYALMKFIRQICRIIESF